MPDHRCHRGAHPQDRRLFEAEACFRLQSAAQDLVWLLSRDYASPSALKLVGDRYALEARQREAVSRCACSDEKLARRRAAELSADQVIGQELWVDAFNTITTVESALSGGLLLQGRDGCFRDLAGVHGTYRQVQETLQSLLLLGDSARSLQVDAVRWFLDRPVSNSGRLGQLLRNCAQERGWNMEVQLVDNPDALLIAGPAIVVSADSGILDRCRRWFNLTGVVLKTHFPQAWILRLFQ